MNDSPPVVYLFHGEDEFAIAQSVAELEARLGDAPVAEMNTTRLDGRVAGLEEVRMVAYAMPFLTPRRLVILSNPLARLNSPALHEKFSALLDDLPASTGLVLTEYKTLKKDHWLLKWAEDAGKRAFIKAFSLRDSAAIARWIQERAKNAGGSFDPQAARLLAELVGEDTRLAYQEIEKLVAYTNGQRPVEAEDVDLLTAAEGKLENFALPNALREMDGRRALNVLHRMLEDEDPIMLLGSVAKQVRILLLAREVLDEGGGVNEVVTELTRHPSLKISAYPARLAAGQAQQMAMADLEAIYRRLLEIDEAIKTSQIDGDVALDLFVTTFTAR